MTDEPLLDELSELGRSLRSEADAFPWSIPSRDRADWEDMWCWWNVGFIQAAARLFRAVELLNTDSLSDEAMLPLRSLLELVANQGDMAEDPETRAREYAEADLRTRGRHLDGLVRLGLGDFKPEGIERLRTEIAAIRDEVAPLIAEIETMKSVYPFGKVASVRAGEAGMPWHYGGVYVIASDFVHMNARAVSQYVSRIQGAREEQRPVASKLVMACEFLLRSLYFGDLAVEQGHRADLDDHARTYARIALPDLAPERVVHSLWPPQIRPVE